MCPRVSVTPWSKRVVSATYARPFSSKQNATGLAIRGAAAHTSAFNPLSANCTCASAPALSLSCLAFSAGFATLAGRLDRGEEIARGLERWARTRSAAEVADRLQRAGVAASLVANGADLARDPALLHRGFFETVADGDGRGWTFDGVPFRSSGQAGFVVAPGPLLGEHTDAVLGDVLGLGGDELAALRREGVIA